MPLTVNPGTITAKLRLDPNFSPQASAQKEVAVSIQARLRKSDIQAILKASSTPPKNPKFQVTVLRDGTILKSQEGTKTQILGIMDNTTALFKKLYPKPASTHPLPDHAKNEALAPPLDPVQESTGSATIHTSPTVLQDSDNSIVVNTTPGPTQSAEGGYEIHTSPLQQDLGFATIQTSPTSVNDPNGSIIINTQPFIQSRGRRQESDDDSTFEDAQDNPYQHESATVYTSPSAEGCYKRRTFPAQQNPGSARSHISPNDSATIYTEPSVQSREGQPFYNKSSFSDAHDGYDPNESQSLKIYTRPGPHSVSPLSWQTIIRTTPTKNVSKSRNKKQQSSNSNSDLHDERAHEHATKTIQTLPRIIRSHASARKARYPRLPAVYKNGHLRTRLQNQNQAAVTSPTIQRHLDQQSLAAPSSMEWESHQNPPPVLYVSPLQVAENLTSNEDILISTYAKKLQSLQNLASTPEDKRLLTLLETSFNAYKEELISKETLQYLLEEIKGSTLDLTSSDQLSNKINEAIYKTVDTMYRNLHKELKQETLYEGERVLQNLLDLLFEQQELLGIPLETRVDYLLSIRESTKSTVPDQEALQQLITLKESLIKAYSIPSQNSTLTEAARRWERDHTNPPKTQPSLYSSRFAHAKERIQPAQSNQDYPLELVRSYINRYATTKAQFSNPEVAIVPADIRLLDLLTPIINAESIGLLAESQLINLIQTIDARSEALNDETTFPELQSTITAQLQAATSLNRRGSHPSLIRTLLPPITTTSSPSTNESPQPWQQPSSIYDRRFGSSIRPQPEPSATSRHITQTSKKDTNTSATSIDTPLIPTTSDASAESNEGPGILSINHTGTQTSRTAAPYVHPPSYAASVSTFKHTTNSNTEAIPSETLTINEVAPLKPPTDLQITQEYYDESTQAGSISFETSSTQTEPLEKHPMTESGLQTEALEPIKRSDFSIQTEDQPMLTTTVRDAQTSPIPTGDADMQPALPTRSISSQYEAPITTDQPSSTNPPTLNTFKDLHTQLDKKLNKTPKEQTLLPILKAISQVDPAIFSHIHKPLLIEVLEQATSEDPFKKTTKSLLSRVQLDIDEAGQRHAHFTKPSKSATDSAIPPPSRKFTNVAASTNPAIVINDPPVTLEIAPPTYQTEAEHWAYLATLGIKKAKPPTPLTKLEEARQAYAELKKQAKEKGLNSLDMYFLELFKFLDKQLPEDLEWLPLLLTNIIDEAQLDTEEQRSDLLKRLKTTYHTLYETPSIFELAERVVKKKDQTRRSY